MTLFHDWFRTGSLALCFIVLQAGAYQPVTPPAWASDPCAVRVLYLFPDNNQTLTPDQSTVPFGTPSASVTLGVASDGWQDPQSPIATPGGDTDNGAWDLGAGPEGAVRITIVAGNHSGGSDFESYNVKIKVNAVCYQLFTQLPALAAEGYQLNNLAVSDSFAFDDPFWGTWKNRTWSAEIEEVKEDTVTLTIVADASGSLIDAVEIYLLAEPVMLPATARGTPHSWFERFGIVLASGDEWDDADYYDSDGDGMLNWEEYVAGTDPTDAKSLLKIIKQKTVPGSPPYIEWIGGTNGVMTPYVIECTPTLRLPDWQPVGQSPRVEGTNTWQGDAVLEQPFGFYRIVASQK